jgi:hypothetical protein
MKSIFASNLQEELISRINSLTTSSQARWGKMTLCQMLKHCSSWDEWMLGIHKPVYKQAIIGKLFGKTALKKLTKDDRELDKNTPTVSAFKPKDSNCDIEQEKKEWVSLIRQYSNYHNPGFIHIFFGRMTREQVGILAYKHTDHHLRQFGV